MHSELLPPPTPPQPPPIPRRLGVSFASDLLIKKHSFMTYWVFRSNGPTDVLLWMLIMFLVFPRDSWFVCLFCLHFIFSAVLMGICGATPEGSQVWVSYYPTWIRPWTIPRHQGWQQANSLLPELWLTTGCVLCTVAKQHMFHDLKTDPLPFQISVHLVLSLHYPHPQCCVYLCFMHFFLSLLIPYSWTVIGFCFCSTW